jgi:hypothetical protein
MTLVSQRLETIFLGKGTTKAGLRDKREARMAEKWPTEKKKAPAGGIRGKFFWKK